MVFKKSVYIIIVCCFSFHLAHTKPPKQQDRVKCKPENGSNPEKLMARRSILKEDIHGNYLRETSTDLQLHVLTPSSVEHIDMLARLKNKNSKIIFWNGIGGFDTTVEVIASMKDITSQIPQKMLGELNWFQKYTDVEISLTRRKMFTLNKTSNKSKLIGRSSIKRAPTRDKEEPQQTLLDDIINLAGTTIFTGRFYEIFSFPDENVCMLFMYDSGLVKCIKVSFLSSLKRVTRDKLSKKLSWTFVKFDNGKLLLKCKAALNKHVKYDHVSDTFYMVKDSRVIDASEHFTCGSSIIIGLTTSCSIRTGSGIDMAAGKNDSSTFDVVSDKPFAKLNFFSLVANERFKLLVHESAPLIKKTNWSDPVELAETYVINRSDVEVYVTFEDKISYTSTEVTTKKDLKRQLTQSATQNVPGLENLLINIFATDTEIEHEDTTTDTNITANTYKHTFTFSEEIQILPWTEVRLVSRLKISHNQTVPHLVVFKFVRLEDLVSKDSKSNYQFRRKALFPAYAVLKTLELRGDAKQLNVQVIDNLVTFNVTASASTVKISFGGSSYAECYKTQVHYVQECHKNSSFHLEQKTG